MDVHYLLILDESSSMVGQRDVTIKNYNEQLDLIRKKQKQSPDNRYRISLTTFSDEVRFVKEREDIRIIDNLTHKDYNPHGMTALRDAMGLSMDNLRQHIHDDDYVIMVVFTDGEENCSREISQSQVKKLVEELKASDKWNINYVGQELKEEKIADNFGINRGNICSYSAEAVKGGHFMKDITKSLQATLESTGKVGFSKEAFETGNDETKEIEINR